MAGKGEVMKRPAPLLLLIAFLLLAGGAGGAAAAPAVSPPGRDPSTVAGAQQPQPRDLELAALSDKLTTVLLNQSRLSIRVDQAITGLWVSLGLLVLTAVLAGAGLLLALRHRRAVLVIEGRLGDLDGPLQAWSHGALSVPPPPEGPAASEETAGSTGKSRSVDVLSELEKLRQEAGVAGSEAPTAAAPAALASRASAPAWMPAAGSPPDPDPEARQQAAAAPATEHPEEPNAARSTTAVTEAPPALPGALHIQCARLLNQLRLDAPRLAARFADPATRERFLYELDAPLGTRLDRFRAVAKLGDEKLRQTWLGPDLVTTLDSLAHFYSVAVAEERRGHATGLAAELRAWLYDAFGSLCRDAGWFVIDPVEPYVTRFDPRFHHAVAGRDVNGAEGRIVDIKAIGRRDPASGVVAHKAEVIVGR
jgi:hypothetical protein